MVTESHILRRMSNQDIESIAYEVVDYFREQEVRKMIQAIKEDPNNFVRELEKLIGGDKGEQT